MTSAKQRGSSNQPSTITQKNRFIIRTLTILWITLCSLSRRARRKIRRPRRQSVQRRKLKKRQKPIGKLNRQHHNLYNPSLIKGKIRTSSVLNSKRNLISRVRHGRRILLILTSVAVVLEMKDHPPRKN